MAPKKEWMLGLPGHDGLIDFEEIQRLIAGGQLRETDMVKKGADPWRSAGDIPELRELFLRPALRPKAPPRPTTWVPKSEPRPRAETGRVSRAEAGAPAPKSPPAAPRRSEETAAKPPPGKPAGPPKAPPAKERTTEKGTAPVSPQKSEDRKPPPGPATPDASRKAEEKPSPPGPRPAPVGKEESRSAAPPAPAEKEKEKPPAAEGPVPPAPPHADSTRIEKAPTAPQVPRRPAVPRLEPMSPKYFSPVDLLRAASHSFEPRKLLVAAAALVPLMVLWSLLDLIRRGVADSWLQPGIFLVSTAVLIFGLSAVWTALAYATRRQLEGIPYRAGEVVVYGVRNLATAIIYPLLVLIPSLLALSALWVLGMLRDLSAGMAAVLKILFILPLSISLVAMAGALGYQLASMYIPSAAAVEGAGIGGAVRAAWAHIRHQVGRMVLHWLIVTVAVGVILIVCLGLVETALRLPDWVFGVPRDAVSLQAYERWRGFEGLFSVYRGLAYGLGLTLPVSLLSTLGVLSYLTLRHPVSAPLPGPLEETGGIGMGRAAEATHPADTWEARPGMENGPPPGETRPAPPAVTEDVADDQGEESLN